MKQNEKESTNVLYKNVGNIEATSNKLSPSRITIVGIKENIEKSDGTTYKVPLIQFLCKHPEKSDPIAISKIKIIINGKVITKNTWEVLDKDDNIQKGSSISDVLNFLECNCLADTEGKKLNTIVESKDNSFLCLKLFN